MKPRLKNSAALLAESAPIGARMKSIREMLDASQARVGRALGMTRDRYVNLESGRTPISTENALDFCLKFVVSEKWLATGEGLKRRFMNLRQDSIYQLREGELPLAEAYKIVLPEMPFAKSYGLILGKRYEELATENQFGIRLPSFETVEGCDVFLDVYLQMWGLWIMLPGEVGGLIQSLIEAGNDYCRGISPKSKNMPIKDIERYHALEGLPICSEAVLRTFKKHLPASLSDFVKTARKTAKKQK